MTTTTRSTARTLALKSGRTRLIAVSSPLYDLVLWIAPDEDLDGCFWANCAETGDALQVNGWLIDLHDGAADRDEVAREFGDWREATAA